MTERGRDCSVLMFNDYVRVKCSMEMSVHERTEDSDSELMPLNGVGESDPILWVGSDSMTGYGVGETGVFLGADLQ